jgi:hypothetical protein
VALPASAHTRERSAAMAAADWLGSTLLGRRLIGWARQPAEHGTGDPHQRGGGARNAAIHPDLLGACAPLIRPCFIQAEMTASMCQFLAPELSRFAQWRLFMNSFR